MKKMKKDYLYETIAVNKDGVNGETYINKEDGLSVKVSSPLNNQIGTNPEELLGLSLSTCFNSTIKAILKEKNLVNKSRVEVKVQLKKELEGMGFLFDVLILAAIDDLNPEVIEDIVHAASLRCPVYKLIKESDTVSVHIIDY